MLTKEIAEKLTYIGMIKFFKPEWTDEECDYYLWERTCFPFSLEVLINQLNNQLGKPTTKL